MIIFSPKSFFLSFRESRRRHSKDLALRLWGSLTGGMSLRPETKTAPTCRAAPDPRFPMPAEWRRSFSPRAGLVIPLYYYVLPKKSVECPVRRSTRREEVGGRGRAMGYLSPHSLMRYDSSSVRKKNASLSEKGRGGRCTRMTAHRRQAVTHSFCARGPNPRRDGVTKCERSRRKTGIVPNRPAMNE